MFLVKLPYLTIYENDSKYTFIQLKNRCEYEPVNRDGKVILKRDLDTQLFSRFFKESKLQRLLTGCYL